MTQPPASSWTRTPALGAFAHATVGVADLDAALAFWNGHFGFEIEAARDGADAELAALWALAPDDIAGQALVRSRNARAGALHLVEFARPAAPVRHGARVFDQLPKNLDVYARGLPACIARLQGRGVRLRGDPVSSPGPDGATFSEVHLPGHDETNVVLIEVSGKGYDIDFNTQGFAGIGPLVAIVPDLRAEQAFYGSVLGMVVTLDTRLSGPALERLIGLPAGAALLVRVYGDPAEPLGRVEIIEYEGVAGRNLYERARPPALGTLHVTYRVPRLGPILDRLRAAAVGFADHGPRQLLYGSGRMVSLRSPAGLRIELQEDAAA